MTNQNNKSLPNSTKSDINDLVNIEKHHIDWPSFPKKSSKGLYSFKSDIFEYDFLYTPGEERRLFVLLSGDANRKKFQPPVFQRWSWASKFPGHCLYISDPTIKLHDDLGLAWYIGTDTHDPIPTIAEIIKKTAVNLNIPLKNVVLYASSGGGFAALKLSTIIPDVVVVAINPQIDVTKYKNFDVEKFLKRCFIGTNREAASNNYLKRFNLLASSSVLKSNKIFYVQNTLDLHHYETHFKMFADEIGLSERNNYTKDNIETILFQHPDGHKKAETAKVFEIVMNKVKNITN